MRWRQSVGEAVRAAQRWGWRPVLVTALLLLGSTSLAIEARRAELTWRETGAATPPAVTASAVQPGGRPTSTGTTSKTPPEDPRVDNRRSTATPADLGSPPPKAATGSPLDLNRATLRELDGLPGIGPALAGRIVAYRQANGPFRTADDLRRVSGIGAGRLAKLQGLVIVTNPEVAAH